MQKKKIGVVILNYLAYRESIDITKQFLKLPTKDIDLQVVVVDNKSPNESYFKIKKAFDGEEKVLVVQTDSNLGFANGNNYGYSELVKLFMPDYVIFSNSDIVLKNDRLFDWIIRMDEQNQFGVLGPSVYSLRGKFHQNPNVNRNTNLRWNKEQLNKMRMKKFAFTIFADFPFLFSIVQGLRKEKTKQVDWGDYTKLTTNQTLHGSFLIMSQRYLSKYITPFDTGTFLYMEEDILKLRCLKKNIKMVYSPDYEVNHKQAVSTVRVNNSEIKRKLIRINNEMNSLKRYIEVLEEK